MPYGGWKDVDPKVREIWYTRDEELEPEVFDSFPDWMEQPEEEIHTIYRDNEIVCKSIINSLSERELKVIQLNYYGDESLTDIGKIFGISPERIKQIRDKALRKMRYQLYAIKPLVLWGRDPWHWKERLTTSERKLVYGDKKFMELKQKKIALLAIELLEAQKRQAEIDAILAQIEETRKNEITRTKEAVKFEALLLKEDDVLRELAKIARWDNNRELERDVASALYVKRKIKESVDAP